MTEFFKLRTSVYLDSGSQSRTNNFLHIWTDKKPCGDPIPPHASHSVGPVDSSNPKRPTVGPDAIPVINYESATFHPETFLNPLEVRNFAPNPPGIAIRETDSRFRFVIDQS